uniref:Calpain catalytic domain-containing protein n=1 Tax=Strigamia maritima TaxID=126957 RepID=T1JH14_STRMM
MSEYEKLRRLCAKKGEFFEDADFPASQASVFYHQTPPFQFVWKRPKEWCSKPVFIADGNNEFDIIPGKLGDQWFVSCLGCLNLTRGLFYRVVPADQGFDDENYAGIFRFRIWWCGEWQEVVVDDRLPTVNSRLVFVQCNGSNQFWASLLEKAYAKLHGSYEALKYGCSLDGLADLTGGITESVKIFTDHAMCTRLLNKLLDMTSIVTCTVNQSQVRSHAEKLPNGIMVGTNYRVLCLDKAETYMGNKIQLICLRNPLPISATYSGEWAKHSKLWDDISTDDIDRLDVENLLDNEFWMPFDEFASTFTHLELVHLDSETSKDEPSLRSRCAWQMRMWQSAWQKGVTAGGCRNNSDTFHINPQFHLMLSDMEEVIISLNQHCILEPKVIGYTLYQLPKNNADNIDKSFYKKNKSFVNSQYTNSRQVTHRCQLEQGGYVIIPTTFEPGQEATLIDVMPVTSKSAILKAPVTSDPKGLGQYEAVFLQLANEHKTINMFELQELLEAVLPNDYVKSCASLEVCRQIVLALDSSGSGRLKFSDFMNMMCSLKYWQNAFKKPHERHHGSAEGRKTTRCAARSRISVKHRDFIASRDAIYAQRWHFAIRRLLAETKFYLLTHVAARRLDTIRDSGLQFSSDFEANSRGVRTFGGDRFVR